MILRRIDRSKLPHRVIRALLCHEPGCAACVEMPINECSDARLRARAAQHGWTRSRVRDGGPIEDLCPIHSAAERVRRAEDTLAALSAARA